MAQEGTTNTEFEKISLKPIKGSKKSKKSWRKHADIADIEEFLEEVRRDERTGGPASNKPDGDLFFVEKKTEPEKKKIGGKKSKSKVGIEVNESDDEEYVPRKKKLNVKLSKEAEMLLKQKDEARAAKVQTIWGQEVFKVTDAYLESTVKKKKVKPKTVNVGRSDVDAVMVAEPGASYNPDYDAHQELLLKAHEEELKKVTEQTKWSRKVKMVSVKELKKQSKLWLKEMSEGLSQDPEESQENDATGTPVVAPPPLSAGKRKTLQQRRKNLLMKKANQLKLEEKKRKVRLNDILRIKSLKKEIGRTRNASSMLHVKRTERKCEDERKPKRLSKHKFVEAQVNVQLSDELTGSLRELKPDGSLLNDRFKSLQRRNIIETRNRILPHRRYRRKVIIKRSYKNDIKAFKSRR